VKKALPIEYRKLLGHQVREQRKAKNITQQELANLSDLELSTVNRIELGKAAMSVTNLIAISEALEIHPKILWDFPLPKKNSN
jgi:transcriptional regulator with XRE-family HTH domain